MARRSVVLIARFNFPTCSAVNSFAGVSGWIPAAKSDFIDVDVSQPRNDASGPSARS